MDHQTLTVISALMLGAPFAVHYVVHKVRARKVHMITFEEIQNGVKAIVVRVQDARVLDLGLIYESGDAHRIEFGDQSGPEEEKDHDGEEE